MTSVTYSERFEDCLAFHHWLNYDRLRRTTWRSHAFLGLVFAAVLVPATVFMGDGLPLATNFAIAGFSWLVVVGGTLALYPFKVRRNVRALFAVQPKAAETVRLTDTGIESTSEAQRLVHPWTAVKDLVIARGLWIAVLEESPKSVRAAYVPAAAFPDRASFDAFTAEARRLHAQHRA